MARRPAVVSVLLLGLALAGCGGGSGGGVASAGGAPNADAQAVAAVSTTGPTSDDDKRLAFAKCMRENGVDVPDPQPGQTGRGRFNFGDNGIDPEKFRAAAQDCRKLLPNGGEPPKLNPEQIEQFRKLAGCMRDNGVAEFPDPDADGRIPFQNFRNLNRDDPTVKAAFDKCRDLAPFRRGLRASASPTPGTG